MIESLTALFKGNIPSEIAPHMGYEDTLTITNKYRTSNDLCPVVDYELTSGSGYFDFVDDGTVDDFGDKVFTITLNANTNNEVGVWPFQITGKALGSENDSGGTGTLSLEG